MYIAYSLFSQYFTCRWLINKGRYKDAEEVVKLAAHVNGTPITTAFTFVPRDIRIDGSDKEEGMFLCEIITSLFTYSSYDTIYV